jgi:hypothetical protein
VLVYDGNGGFGVLGVPGELGVLGGLGGLVGCWRGRHTPSSSSRSSRWRGITVTSSISHRNAISGGVSPGGRGNAMIATRDDVISKCLDD